VHRLLDLALVLELAVLEQELEERRMEPSSP